MSSNQKMSKIYKHDWKAKIELAPIVVTVIVATALARYGFNDVPTAMIVGVALGCASVGVSGAISGEELPCFDAPANKWFEFIGACGALGMLLGAFASVCAAGLIALIKQFVYLKGSTVEILHVALALPVVLAPVAISLYSHSKRPPWPTSN